jgi:hypothetical protein
MVWDRLPALHAAFPDYSRRSRDRVRHFRMHIPVATSILASLVLAVLFLLF